MEFKSLESLWKRLVTPNKVGSDNINWNQEMESLYALGIGMEETLGYLYSKQPNLDEFKHWLNLNRKDLSLPDTSNLPDVLLKDDIEFWKENGYLVIKNAVPRLDAEATQKAIWQFLGMDENNPQSWYKPHEELRGLMLTFTHHSTLQKNRQSARIKKAFEQLYNSTNIYQRVDKVSFNPPITNRFNFAGDNLHWDVSLKQPIQYGLQGLLYLTDCGISDGAFNCVPGFHTKIKEWINQLPPGANPRGLAPQILKPVSVPGNAGDFVVWHQALPHCATPNKGNYPRMVQYLTYLPVGYKDEKVWI
jgi:hypothetical protein